jgi:Acetyltransferase (GNAT) domain
MSVPRSGSLPKLGAVTDMMPAFKNRSSITSAASGISVIRTLEGIESLRDVWTSWKGHRDSEIDFYIEFVGSHKDIIRPHVIVLYGAGRPDAMLIGRLEHRRIDYKLGGLRLVALKGRVLSFMYGGLRGNKSRDNCDELIRSIMNSLAEDEADAAFLHQVNRGSALYDAALELPPFSCRDHVARPSAHHFINLPQDSGMVFPSLSRSQRKDVRRSTRNLLADYDNRVIVRCFVDSGELDLAIREVNRVAERTYQKGLGFGFEDTPPMRHLLDFFARKKCLRIYVLYAADNPCAFSVGNVSNGVYCGDFLGYDRQFAQYSPGNLLLVAVMEDLCKLGVRVVDLGPGNGMYKERFGNQIGMEASLRVFAPTIKGLALNILYSVSTVVDRALKLALTRVGLLSRIKAIWRRRAITNRKQPGETQLQPSCADTCADNQQMLEHIGVISDDA